MKVLHVAPHPDDECLGAPAALLALRDAGWEVVNVCCARDEGRRADELTEACRRLGFTRRRDAPPLAVLLRDERFDLVVGPSPHERHPAHVRVAEAVRAALDGAGPDRWWQWGLWGELPQPTLVVPFGEDRLAEIRHALEAHAGELARNDYRRLLTGRAMAHAVLGPELVGGFGAPGLDAPFAELVTELVRTREGWRPGPRRELDPRAPLQPVASAPRCRSARSIPG